MFLENLYAELGIRTDAFGPGPLFTNTGLGPTLGMFFTGSGDSGTRTSTVFMPTDSRRELYYQNRMELVKKSRWLFNNLGLLRRLVNGVARYSVGDGIVPIPETTDDEWNVAAQAYFDDWASNQMLCDVQGKKTFWAMQKQAVRSMLKDGEFFAIQAVGGETQDPEKPDDPNAKVPGRPQLQWIETQIVSNLPTSNVDLSPDGFREGIKLSPQNRALAYRIRKDKDPALRDLSDSVDLDAQHVVHVFDADRAGMTHGLPWAYSGVNSALDVLDLKALESAANKLHSMMAGSIKKKTPDAGLRGFSGALRRERKPTTNGKSKVVAFEEFMGGAAILQLATDEEFNLIKSDRTNSTWLGFMDYLVRDIAYGFGVSPEFIWNVAGMGGANTRFILEDSKWFFQEIQQILIDAFCQRIYVWVIARAMKRKELSQCKDVRWWNCRWQPPAQITVDIGKEGAMMIQLLQNGMLTLEEYYASRGKTADKQMDKRIAEIKAAIKKCKDANVPLSLLFQVVPGSAAAEALAKLDGLDEGDSTTDGKPAQAATPTAEETAATALENRMNNYSNAVKSGVITPNADDEDYWRKELGLPPMSAAVRAVWKADTARFPITIQPLESTKPEPPPPGGGPLAVPKPGGAPVDPAKKTAKKPDVAPATPAPASK